MTCEISPYKCKAGDARILFQLHQRGVDVTTIGPNVDLEALTKLHSLGVNIKSLRPDTNLDYLLKAVRVQKEKGPKPKRVVVVRPRRQKALAIESCDQKTEYTTPPRGDCMFKSERS